MAKNLERKVIKALRGAAKFWLSRQSIPVLKGTLAYLLAFTFIFLKRFDELSKFPLAYSSMMIVVIAGGSGKAVGACIQSVALALAGVSLGCVGFVILAKLSRWPVAQGVVFAIIVYAMALLKSRGPRWFSFSLLCILNSFNGIYTSYMLGQMFSSVYLKAYYEAYLWGGAIVLGVNLLVFPTSSERELRQTLVASLERLGTFAHLLAKGYTLDITDEERAVREHLIQTIRADFGYLTQKIEETTIEINFSRFSLEDYQCFVTRTRALQQALITAYSSFAGVEREDLTLFRERFLPGTLTAFNKLRRAIDMTIRDLGNELGRRPMVIPMTQDRYNEFMDLERRIVSTIGASGARPDQESPSEEFANHITLLSERLAAEVESSTIPPTRAGSPDHTRPRPAHVSENIVRSEEASSGVTSSFIHTFPATPTATGSLHEGHKLPRIETECGMQRLRREFDAYNVIQHDILQEVLIGGQLRGATDGELRLTQPRASLKDTFGTDGIYFDTEGDIQVAHAHALRTRTKSNEKDSSSKAESKGEDSESNEEAKKVLRNGNSLIRVWGFLFALEQFVTELETLWRSVRPFGIKPRKRLHMHLFELIRRPHQKSKVEDEDDEDLPLPEALALLEGRRYTPVKINIWQHLERIQYVIQGPTSIFAAKTAAAASVYGALIYASAPRPWFISYALSSGMLTIIVALAPTLGQSILTFILQIAGSAIGYLWGLAVLEMFRNVGGYKFNPFGIICMLVPYALIMQYVLYMKPAFFVVALLGMNGTGVLIATEWIAVEFLHRPNFDSPVFRAGKGIIALMVALAIVAIFQLFILRNPARRTLRQKVAAIVYEILSYTVLLQAFGRSVLSSDPNHRPSKPALMRVERELRHRELKLQSEIIGVAPLVGFAAAEPEFSRPFRKDIFLRLMRSSQIILGKALLSTKIPGSLRGLPPTDRTREARAALGTQQFEHFILTHFVSVLAPYRARNTRVMKTQLYLTASSLQAKVPLPHDTPLNMMTDRDRADFIHDTLVLSARFAQTEGGAASIRSREFMRYVSYLLCATAVIEPMRAMEEASKDLFGELESKLM